MMKFPHFDFLLVDARANSRTKQVRANPLIAGALVAFSLVVLIGISRIALFATSYAWEKVAFCKERHENYRLISKLDNLDTFLKKENKKLDDLVEFEDSQRLVYGMNPISADIRAAGIGGAVPRGYGADSGNSPLLNKAGKVQESLGMLVRKAQLQNATFAQVGDRVEQVKQFLAEYPSLKPAVGPITSEFGSRMDPMTGEAARHEGIDIANDIGTPIYAPADGIVIEAGMHNNYGRCVIIEHDKSGLQTLYGHMNSFVVHANQDIKRGDLIGFIGNSGKSTGPHLHYEVRRNGHPISPLQFLLPDDQVVD